MFPLLETAGSINDLALNVRWDHASLVREVGRRAAVLSEMGIRNGSTVAIVHSGSAHFFADLFAVWTVGATAACIDPSLTATELQNVITFSEAVLVLGNHASKLINIAVPVIDLAAQQTSGTEAPKPVVEITGFNYQQPGLLLFTSGTTGTPKGVVLTFDALFTRIRNNIEAIGSATLARTLVSLPTFFGHGLIGNSLTPLAAGGTILLHPLGVPLIKNLGPIIDDNGVTFMSSVPSLWRLALASAPKPKRQSLKRVHVGSAPLSAALWSDIAAWTQAEVVNCYGITETANWIAGASSMGEVADGLVGTMWGGEAAVMDDNGTILARGTGEIVVRSSCLMSGYLKRQDLTDAAFFNGYFRTGDQGHIDDDNRIWITGRIKDEINRGGFKVQPAEIDTLLESHDAVAEACVFGLPDPMGGEAVAAAIRLKAGQEISSLKLQGWCSERLRRAAVPEHWFFVSEIPRTARGKVSRDNVRRLLTQSAPKVTTPLPAANAIAIAATFIADPVVPPLVFALQESTKKTFAVRFAAYNQVIEQLSSAVGLLSSNSTGPNAVLLRLEDFVRDVEDVEAARATLAQSLAKLQAALKRHSEIAKVKTLLVVFPNSPNVPRPLRTDIEAATQSVLSLARSLSGLDVIFVDEAPGAPAGKYYDQIAEKFANIPFTEEHYASIALLLARRIYALETVQTQWPSSWTDGAALRAAMRNVAPRTISSRAKVPGTELEHQLIELWQSILGVEAISLDDDYFALGGTSLMAARLFAEVARQFGERLPLTTILECPTIRSLSLRIRGVPANDAGAIIDLKRGGSRTLFFVHDGEGETLLYRNLAQRLPSDVSAAAIEPPRLPRMPVALGRIEDMATHYITLMRARQPHGPYLLGGMCAGGVIAYEMAAQLVRSGESVDVVALLDAPTPQARKKSGRITRQRLQRFRQVIEDSRTLTATQMASKVVASFIRRAISALTWEVSRRARDLSIRARFRFLRTAIARKLPWPGLLPELTAHQILNAAQAAYSPPALSIVPVVLARASSGEGIDTPYAEIYADPNLGWSDVATELAVIDVAGGHSSMLQESFVDSLAKELSPYLSQHENKQQGIAATGR